MPSDAKIELTVRSASTSRSARRNESDPARIIVFAPLTLRPQEPWQPVARRLTIDNFDDVMRQLGPAIPLNPADSSKPDELSFGCLDDFHPDRLISALPQLRELMALRSRLAHAETAEAALQEVRDRAEAGSHPSPAPGTSAPKASDNANGPGASEGDDAMFDRLLGQKRSDSETRSHAQQTVQALIKDALGSQSKPKSAEYDEATHDVEHAVAAGLREALVSSPFRTLERSWRSLHWLVSRLSEETGELHIVDGSLQDIARHLLGHTQPIDETGLHRLLCEDEDGWDIIVADMSFRLDMVHLTLLATLGAIAARCKAPLVAGAHLTLAGCMSDASIESPWEWAVPDNNLGQLWTSVRKHPAARWIALAAPRFVLRYPYGPRSEPINTLPFEELAPPFRAEQLLWGNAAFPAALLIAESRFADTGTWPAPQPGGIDDLPAPLYFDGSGDAIQPPVEFLLGERATMQARQCGLTIFAGGRNSTRIATSSISPIGFD